MAARTRGHTTSAGRGPTPGRWARGGWKRRSFGGSFAGLRGRLGHLRKIFRRVLARLRGSLGRFRKAFGRGFRRLFKGFLDLIDGFRGFPRATRGNVTVVLALAAMPMLGAVGLGTDSALAFMVKARMQRALDAAGLVAGRVVFSENVEADAQAFFDANFPADYLGSTVTQFAVSTDAEKEFVTLTAEASYPTRFMDVFGFEHVSVDVRTVIHRENRGMELALVMDNTGSMRSGGKMAAMKDAAHLLIDIIYGEKTTLPDVWIGVVPYTAAVNIGPAHADWLDAADRVNELPDPFDPTDWLGCVEARAAPLDQDDTAAGRRGLYLLFLRRRRGQRMAARERGQRREEQRHGAEPRLRPGDHQPDARARHDRRSDHRDAALAPGRDDEQPRAGLGWRTLSPRWQGLWGGPTPDTMPLAYDQPLIDKVVVILTDGQNQFYDFKGHGPGNGVGPGGSDYTAYGRLEDFSFPNLN